MSLYPYLIHRKSKEMKPPLVGISLNSLNNMHCLSQETSLCYWAAYAHLPRINLNGLRTWTHIYFTTRMCLPLNQTDCLLLTKNKPGVAYRVPEHQLKLENASLRSSEQNSKPRNSEVEGAQKWSGFRDHVLSKKLLRIISSSVQPPLTPQCKADPVWW